MRHYVDVTDADFERAIEMGDAQAARKAAQYLPEVEGNEGKTDDPENAKASEIPRLSGRCNPLRDKQLEAAGIANPPYAFRHKAFICKALETHALG